MKETQAYALGKTIMEILDNAMTEAKDAGRDAGVGPGYLKELRKMGAEEGVDLAKAVLAGMLDNENVFEDTFGIKEIAGQCLSILESLTPEAFMSLDDDPDELRVSELIQGLLVNYYSSQEPSSEIPN